MKSLNRRLQKLEAAIVRAVPFPSWADQFAAIERCMLPGLSAEDRELWLRKTPPENGHPVWNRWSEAFERAAAEARVPFAMVVADREWGN